jgi:uncharacterized damage-inducible protein DinB
VKIVSERAQALAEQFEQANNEAIAAVEGCSDEQWRRHVESENRSVGVVMHHVAIAHPVIAEWLTAAARGQDVGVLPTALRGPTKPRTAISATSRG